MDDFGRLLSLLTGWFKSLDTVPQAVCLLALAICVIVFLRGLSKRDSQKKQRRKPRSDYDDDFTKYSDVRYLPLEFMSRTEINFWALLYQAVPGYHIFPQVATSALLNIESPNSDHFHSVLRAFSTTRIDFVVCDANLKVLALVELDDVSHDQKREKDRRRDFITAKAGYKTVRFDCRRWPTVEQIKQKIFTA